MRRAELQQSKLLLAGLCLTLLGCGTTKPIAPSGPVIRLDPMVLKAQNGQVKALEARPLFKTASQDYSRGRYAGALEKFRTLVEEFPKSRYAPHALFNAGLSAMRLKRWEEGLALQRRARKALAGKKDEWDALLQVSMCLEKLERWTELDRASSLLLERGRLSIVGRVEARARLGMARYHTGRLALAERAFDRVLADYKKNNGVPGLQANAYVSRAQYMIGEIYRGLFDSIRFRLPVERMKRDLTDKSAFFLKGQSAYLRCVRYQHEYWAVAAGYRLGKLYEDFYDDMMQAEVPPELDAEDKDVYYEELRKHIKPLVLRAIEVYERNLGMSDRLGVDDDWSQKTRASLDRMREILRREFQ